MKPILTLLLFLSACDSLPAADRQARVIRYSDQDIIELRCQMRVSTAIVLPAGEQILDFTTGDKEHWIVNGAQNFCYVHPAKPGSTSNLNLICASGNIYSFLLNDVGEDASGEVDYKVFVEPRETSRISLSGSPNPRFVPAEELAASRAQVTALQEQMSKTQQEAQKASEDQIHQYRSRYPASLKFPYRYRNQSPFQVTAIFHDEAFTYIYSSAREKPAIYEVKDNQPNLIPFQLENGCYIIPKVLDHGYLQIGKKKMAFRRQG
ncbi:MAG: TrbG/VirB9 family P-type conjugative transfer protein [Acidobacteriota bacterium]